MVQKLLFITLIFVVPSMATQAQFIALNDYQQLNVSAKHYPMQTNLIVSVHDTINYPQLIVGFDSDLKFSVGTLFNYSTEDFFFYNEHQQNVSMGQIQYESMKVKGVVGYNTTYLAIGLADTISLTANKNDEVTMGAIGLHFKALEWADVSAHYYIGDSYRAKGTGYKASVTMPIQLFDLTNELNITSISMEWDTPITFPEWTGFFNHHKTIKQLLFKNSNAIIFSNNIEYETDLFNLFFRYSYLDSPSHYLSELGIRYGLNANTQFLFKFSAENEESKIIGGVIWRGSF
jgi:hypothetical protein